MKNRKNKIYDALKNKEYRDGFVKASIDVGVPSQILALREQRGWTQEDLGAHADMKQESISRIEDPTRGSVNLKTLIRLASAFDVGLMVRFAPFNHLVNLKLNLSLEALEVDSFTDESYFQIEEPLSNTFIKTVDSAISQDKPLKMSVRPTEIDPMGELISIKSQKKATEERKPERTPLHEAFIG